MSEGERIALLIGVGNYTAGGLKPLHTPPNSVAALKPILENPQIGNFSSVKMLINPTLTDMREALAALFDNRSRRDLVALYFAGHGVKDERNELYLANCNTALYASGQLNKATALEASFVRNLMANSRAQSQVIILDCCFSGAFPDGVMAMEDKSVDVQSEFVGSNIPEGRAVMTAATSTQYALEQEEETLSVYTRYLVEGLKTGAAVQSDREVIWVSDLHNYISAKVRVAAAAMSPQLYAANDGSKIPLAKVFIADPALRFRKEVEKRIHDGEFSGAAQSFFERQRIQLGLSEADTRKIIEEVRQPFVERQENLLEYRKAFQADVERWNPLPEWVLSDLQDLQRGLNLRDKDIQPIEADVLEKAVRPLPNDSSSDLGSKFTPLINGGFDRRRFFQTAAQTVATFVTGGLSVIALQNVGNAAPLTARVGIEKKRLTVEFSVVKVDAMGHVIDTQRKSAELQTADLGSGVALELMAIPQGSFMMGSLTNEEGRDNDESPQHSVAIKPFWMGKYAVTQAQWRAVAGLPKVSRDLTADPANFKGLNLPVEQVTWEDATEFCARLSQKTGQAYRLPSEAEWEYACRAGTTTPFYFGETITTDLANYAGTGTYGSAPKGQYRQKTIDVGSFPPNAFGLYDMHGNVWEWCQDNWHTSYAGAPTDGSAWIAGGEQSLRVMRGGSWNLTPRNCRSAIRGRYSADCRAYNIGFRVVCSLARAL
jgi:formylglycine-generating enzyme required for sulfatase activity/uncharacterized caspase-like protein